MRITLASASLVAIALAATTGVVSAADESATPEAPKSVQVQATAPSSAAGRFATLKGVEALPMASIEMEAVKGQHIHFVTPSQNNQHGETGLHLVNSNNTGNWSDLYGDGPVGPGYHGLCGAALNSLKLFIPGQGPTGHGGGC